MKAALDQIKSFQKRTRRQWRLDVPVWQLALEGLVAFLLAFVTGLGLAVLYSFFTN